MVASQLVVGKHIIISHFSYICINVSTCHTIIIVIIIIIIVIVIRSGCAIISHYVVKEPYII